MNKKTIASLIVTMVLLVVIIGHHRHASMKKAESIATSVRALHAQLQSITTTTTATGYLQAQESTTITPKVSGYIQTIAVHAGDYVKAGVTLFQLDNEKEKDALNAAIANDKLSQLQCQRNKELFQKGFITHDEYYTALVTMKQNEAALQTAQTNLSDKTIQAPFSGTLGAINVSVGDFVNPGTALIQLVDDQHLKVTYSLPVKNLIDIHLNQSVTITSEDSTHTIIGKINYISPTVDQATQTISVQALLENTSSIFKPGEFVTVTQQIGENTHAILIPEQSVSGSIDGYSVFIAKNNIAVQQPVTTGDRRDGSIIITSGLKPGDLVIIAGQDALQNGQPINIIDNKAI